jgi:hypothetical protein
MKMGQMGFLGFVAISLIVGPMLIISIKSFAPKLSKFPHNLKHQRSKPV